MEMSQIKIHQDLPHAELSQREERLGKTFFVFSSQTSRVGDDKNVKATIKTARTMFALK
jgi:hypothetical protein